MLAYMNNMPTGLSSDLNGTNLPKKMPNYTRNFDGLPKSNYLLFVSFKKVG